jgi:hypothetical protein
MPQECAECQSQEVDLHQTSETQDAISAQTSGSWNSTNSGRPLSEVFHVVLHSVLHGGGAVQS